MPIQTLFTNTDDIKAYLPVSKNMEFGEISPFITQAERDFIIPVLGVEQYHDLLDNITTPDQDQENLLNKVKPALAAFACLLWIPVGQLHLNSDGIRISVTEDQKTAFQWQIEDLKKTLIASGNSAVDNLLVFLEEEKATYTLWAGGSGYTVYKECFILDTAMFNQYNGMIGSSRRNFMSLRSTMKKVEELAVKTTIGVDLFDEIKQQLLDDDLTDENKDLLKFIRPAVANLTISKGIRELQCSIESSGVLQFNSVGTSGTITNQQPAKDNVVFRIEKEAYEDGQNFLGQLRQFLNDNQEDYPLYENSSANLSANTPTFPNDSNNSFYGAF